MNDEDREILNNLVNKKKQVLEFKEIQSINNKQRLTKKAVKEDRTDT